eukprot:Filipodium_phascolosomae@DN1785_c0_g1_i3.p1
MVENRDLQVVEKVIPKPYPVYREVEVPVHVPVPQEIQYEDVDVYVPQQQYQEVVVDVPIVKKVPRYVDHFVPTARPVPVQSTPQTRFVDVPVPTPVFKHVPIPRYVPVQCGVQHVPTDPLVRTTKGLVPISHIGPVGSQVTIVPQAAPIVPDQNSYGPLPSGALQSGIVPPVMQPGMPGMHPGMQPGMVPGMQPMQPGMQPGMLPAGPRMSNYGGVAPPPMGPPVGNAW